MFLKNICFCEFSSTLCIEFWYYIVYSFIIVYSVLTVNTVYNDKICIKSSHYTESKLYSLYTVLTVFTFYTVYTVYTVYSMQYTVYSTQYTVDIAMMREGPP